MHIETERLIVRPLQEEDIVHLVSIWTDPAVTAFMGGPRDAAKLSASLEERIRSGDEPVHALRSVVEKSSGRVIGHCGLLRKEVDDLPEIELVYVIASDAWGRGFATEAATAIRDHAFASLGCRRLIALIDPENAASERVAVKVGMNLERETVRPGGRRMRLYSMRS